MIQKLLIANRGEIAVRVIRAAREMGIRTVAVYSEADAHAMHVRIADQAVDLGESEPAKSYLDIDKVIAAAKDTGADAIHPGYGFLSERAEFAEACREAGIVFVGPSPEAMRRLGAKIDAKKVAVQAGVPVTPGYFEPNASEDQLVQAALEIGLPVMLKASAGGGGRGMRVVREADQLREELRIAADEAVKGFGDGAMMVEKLIERPRHIEAQILADQHGNVAILFERECSLQRRHQKLVEEAASPLFSNPKFSDVWPKMRSAVEALVRAAEYTGAGTAEFMFDEATGEFYFLEVNARLQVEHPVTECVTGVDLVHQQLRIASGLPLEVPEWVLAGSRAGLNGHAIEVRIVAEDPAHNFLPSVGRILAWAEPKAPGIRVDTGYGPGTEVSRFYDSLIAKVIAHAPTRKEAIARLKSALLDFHILGVKTNIAYLLEILDHPEFVEGVMDTGWLGRTFPDWTPNSDIPAALGAIVSAATIETTGVAGSSRPIGAWDVADDFRVAKS